MLDTADKPRKKIGLDDISVCLVDDDLPQKVEKRHPVQRSSSWRVSDDRPSFCMLNSMTKVENEDNPDQVLCNDDVDDEKFLPV